MVDTTMVSTISSSQKEAIMALKASFDDLVVTLFHPHGTITVPLLQWISTGPGGRWGLRPMAVYDSRTGRQLPLRTIPLQYRNTWYVRLLLFVGVIANPWRNEAK